ncbi:DNA repair and recombination protein RAD54B-like [Pollicipes pollicipes]|uniref:DNA repair and recombination protein RAD54B-like n=1 Tax=Pollicipes pollicipes TaxID=41117 RepID=UPI0018855591|nr:DNA repair and recombination protein RAD54B-like [Pollicipes pollicipes]
MRRSSAPSLGSVNKKGKFCTPFACQAPRAAVQSVRDEKEYVKSVSIVKTKKPEVPYADETKAQASRPAECRRPLTEILSILDHPVMDQTTDNTHSQEKFPAALSSMTIPSLQQDDQQISRPGATNSPQVTDIEQKAMLLTDQTNMSENDSVIAEGSDKPRYFDVIWCKKSARKHKKWEGDAVLEVHRRRVVLLDTERKVIGQGSGYKVKELEDLSDGDLLTVGGKEVEIQNSVRAEEYLSRAHGIPVLETDVKMSYSCQGFVRR